MSPFAAFLLGAATFGPIFGFLFWLWLAPLVRRHAYEVCQERSRLEYRPQPACAEGFDVPPPRHRRRWSLLNRKQPEPEPMTVGPVSILGKQAL